MVSRQVERSICPRPEGDSPVADESRKALCAPAFRCLENDCRIRNLAFMNIEQLAKLQVIVDPPIESEHVAALIDQRPALETGSQVGVVRLNSHPDPVACMHSCPIRSETVGGATHLRQLPLL